MPEQYDKPGSWPKGAPWTLMHAAEAGQTLKAVCYTCHIKRYYKPGEMREVAGNVTVYQLRGKLRCERCKDVIDDVELFHPTAAEAMTIRYRRLVEIKWVRKVIWRDE